jgi:hypothetical protein
MTITPMENKMQTQTNYQLIQVILDQIEDQLLVVSKDIPESNSESIRSRLLLDSLSSIVEDITTDLTFP